MYSEVRVFSENKPGKLSRLSKALGSAGIDILALEIADEGKFGVFKILVADPAKARDVLEEAGMTVALNQVAVFQIPDEPGGLTKLAQTLEDAGVNLTDAYGCILERGKQAVFVVKGENLETIENAAQGQGIKPISSLG